LEYVQLIKDVFFQNYKLIKMKKKVKILTI